MANSATAAQLVTTLDDDAWDDLLSFIEERRVIPIVGPELLLVATDRGPRLLYDWAAEKLAARLNVDTAELPHPYTLNDVVCLFLAARGRREEAYVRLRSIIKDARFEPPPALRHLAAITDFDLFVSTTSDSLLESAINLERFGGAPVDRGAVLRAQSRRRPALPSATACSARWSITCSASSRPHRPTSSRMRICWSSSARCRASTWCRRSSSTSSSTITCCSSAATSPTGSRGCSCAWRSASASRIRATSARCWRTITRSEDDRLVAFLQQVSVRTRIYVGAERFVEELHAALAGAAQARGAPSARAPARFLPPAREMPDNAVFISYAREDLPAVQQIKAGLEAAGITTWFDIDRLEVGDDYDRKIRDNIARCSYFIPVVSATTQRRLEGYFRREWSYAMDRARNMADGALFILPVSIDATDAGRGAGAGQVQGAAFHAAARRAGVAGVRAAPGGLHAGARRMNDVAAKALGRRRGRDGR